MEEAYEHRHRANGGPREEVGIRHRPGPAEGRPQSSAPIAVLPAAGLMVRLGQPDVFGADGLGWDKIAAVFDKAGGAITGSLPLLFCIGVAIGFAKKSDGSTALAALVGFLVYSKVLEAFPVTEAKIQKGADIAATYNNPGVLGGIIMGLLSAVL
jgi:PTS system N-acetylglucosamine-specific IIC component